MRHLQLLLLMQVCWCRLNCHKQHKLILLFRGNKSKFPGKQLHAKVGICWYCIFGWNWVVKGALHCTLILPANEGLYNSLQEALWTQNISKLTKQLSFLGQKDFCVHVCCSGTCTCLLHVDKVYFTDVWNERLRSTLKISANGGWQVIDFGYGNSSGLIIIVKIIIGNLFEKILKPYKI